MAINVDLECDHQVFGDDQHEWPIIADLISDKNAIVYSFGVGSNVSWDSAIIERFGCKVWGFDPTPRSIEWFNKTPMPGRLSFCETRAL